MLPQVSLKGPLADPQEDWCSTLTTLLSLWRLEISLMKRDLRDNSLPIAEVIEVELPVKRRRVMMPAASGLRKHISEEAQRFLDESFRAVTTGRPWIGCNGLQLLSRCVSSSTQGWQGQRRSFLWPEPRSKGESFYRNSKGKWQRGEAFWSRVTVGAQKSQQSLQAMADGMLRSPTFLVGAERQRKNLDDFQRREQQLAEAYHKNKPLCFNASSFQKTHPVKAQKGHNDADACLTAPLVLGVADGVSQIEACGFAEGFSRW
eukprot:symbB.v1.2.012763.t1/scaffold889.1/size154925/10